MFIVPEFAKNLRGPLFELSISDGHKRESDGWSWTTRFFRTDLIIVFFFTILRCQSGRRSSVKTNLSPFCRAVERVPPSR